LIIDSATAPRITPGDVAHAAEDDHAQDEDREAELELVDVDGVLEDAEEHAREAADRRADRVRPQLHAHEVTPIAAAGDLVLADRDPGAPEARVAQAHVDEQHDQQHRQRDEVEAA
jgi:hypothetical protein